jgi:hypothetical protein
VSETDIPAAGFVQHSAVPAGHIVLVFADFVSDDAADDCATNSSDCAAAGQHGPADSAGTGTNGRVPVLPGHVGTGIETEQQGCGHGT